MEHYVQQEDGTYALADTDSMTGTTGERATVEQNNYEDCGTGTYTSTAIKADGSTVVKVRYARTTLHTATFEEEEGGRIWGRIYFTAGTEGETAIPEFPEVSNPGFEPLWYWVDENNVRQYGIVPDTMPNQDMTFYLTWSAGGDTPYKVEHYLQNADGSYTTPVQTDNMTGTTGAQVTVNLLTNLSANQYEAGTYDAETTIAANGATVVQVRYPRTT